MESVIQTFDAVVISIERLYRCICNEPILALLYTDMKTVLGSSAQFLLDYTLYISMLKS